MDLDTTLPFRGSTAVRAGHLTPGALRSAAYRRLEYDTHVDAGVPVTDLLRIRAALVRAGPGAVATGWSACVVLGLDVARGTPPVEISARARRLRFAPGTVARQLDLADDEVTVHAGVPTTTALRTAYDLATRSGPCRSALNRVVDPLVDAVVAADALATLGEFDGPDLAAFAARHPGARGVRRVARVAALLQPGPDSPPETRVRLQVVLAGLPRPVVQHEVRDGFSVRGRLLDLAWPRYRVALEYDGRDHAPADRRGRDIDRIDALRRAGWDVIVVTSVQIARPSWVAERVREALLARGWTPEPGAGEEWAALWAENRRLMHAVMR